MCNQLTKYDMNRKCLLLTTVEQKNQHCLHSVLHLKASIY